MVCDAGIEATIPNHEVFGTGKHGHGGGITNGHLLFVMGALIL